MTRGGIPTTKTGKNGADMSILPSRRSFFRHAGTGFGGLALIDLLSRDGFFASTGGSPSPPAHIPGGEGRNARQHHDAKAKHCVFLFMNGAPSQVDTFD